MKRDAIGLIETRGLVAAVEAVDACLKAANVEFASFRFTTGGLVCIIVNGDVGAVKAAVDAGSAAAERVGQVVGVHVIPRPAGDTISIIDDIDPPPEGAGEDKPSLEEKSERDDEEEVEYEEEVEDDDEEDDQDGEALSKDELLAAVIRLRQMLEGKEEQELLEEGKGLDKHSVRVLRRVTRVLPLEDMDKSDIYTLRKKQLVKYLVDFTVKEGGASDNDEAR